MLLILLTVLTEKSTHDSSLLTLVLHLTFTLTQGFFNDQRNRGRLIQHIKITTTPDKREMTIKETTSTTSTNNNNVSQLEAEYDLNFNLPPATAPSAAVEEEIIVNAAPVDSAYASSGTTYSASGEVLQSSAAVATAPAAPSLPGVGAAKASAAAGAPNSYKVTQTGADGRTTTTTTTTTFVPPPSSNGPPTATVVAGSVVNATTPRVRAPPPGVPAGGTWGRGKTVGPTTWVVCTGISVVSCCIFFLPCGLWAFLCPCDQRDMYSVHNKVYDETGRYLGPLQKVNFQPLRPYI